MLSFCLLLDISHFCQPSVPTYIICQNFNNENEIDKHKFEYSLVLILVYYNHFLHGHFRKRNFYWHFFVKNKWNVLNVHCTKKYIFFFQMFEKMAFPKKLHWNMIFLVLSRKTIFLFPKNMTLFVRQKMKDDLSQKKLRGNIRYFFQMFWKDGLSKKVAL